MKLRDEPVLVVGTKRSGMGAIELLLKQGARVRAMDAQPPSPEQQAKFDAMGVPVMPQSSANTGDAKLIVLSPAVPWDLPMLIEARRRGVPVIGEVELASRFLEGPVIGITGSNGKTTTTALIGHLLKECGISHQIGGNIGTAVTSLVETSKPGQWIVLELSSFQLEAIQQFRAKIAACLNVTPDHLDRHHTFEGYAAAKARLFENQQMDDFAILNYDDATCRKYGAQAKAQVFWFSSSQRVPAGIWLEGETLRFGEPAFMMRHQIKLRGRHNVENVMAAALAAHLVGAKLTQIAEAIQTFPGVEHRIEFVRELNGVEYYNDSKATNVDATLKAIDAFAGGLWIILGGKNKGASYAPLAGPLREKAKAVLVIGAEPPYPYSAAPSIRNALSESVPVIDCGELERAVTYARKSARPGDVVLLAPACASFDQFESYEHRGRAFKQIVEQLS
ncbi:MAG: UDP-N-acetylmuramoyl-L-alanine--D-glutamate ligase [Acidobacteriota bacterium]|nr:UDP-N-acetylmuramoyl-L-alanine--D-glutamate ligase [Acidobacteriota bacterium]